MDEEDGVQGGDDVLAVAVDGGTGLADVPVGIAPIPPRKPARVYNMSHLRNKKKKLGGDVGGEADLQGGGGVLAAAVDGGTGLADVPFGIAPIPPRKQFFYSPFC